MTVSRPLHRTSAERTRRRLTLWATATAAISAEYDRERKASAALTAEVKSRGGFTSALRQKFFLLGERGANHFVAIKTNLDRSTRASDSELAETQRVLSLWLARQIEVDRVLLTSRTTAEFQRRTREIALKIQPLSRRLQTLSADVQAKYPNVTAWGFLPNG